LKKNRKSKKFVYLLILTSTVLNLIKFHPNEIFQFLLEFILSKHNNLSDKDPSIILFENTKYPFIEFESMNDLLNLFLNEKILTKNKVSSDASLELLDKMKLKTVSFTKLKKNLKVENIENEVLDLLWYEDSILFI
jgi:hypothetical protein